MAGEGSAMYKRGFVHRFRNTTALYMPLRTPSDYVAISRSSFRNSDPAVQLIFQCGCTVFWLGDCPAHYVQAY